MSRTSRRISRPLIGLLAVVIALGVFFTVHKLKNTRGADSKSAASAAGRVESLPPPAVFPVARTVSTTQPDVEPLSNDSAALITQTPTEKPTSKPAVASSRQESSPVPGGAIASSQTESPAASEASEPVASHTAAADHAASSPPQSFSAQPLNDAKTKADAGDLVAARQLLNDSLGAGHLSGADAAAAKKQIEKINQTLIFSDRKFPDDPWGGSYQVQSGERLSTIAAKHGVSWELLSRVNHVTPRRLRSGQTIKVFKGPFHAVVYKSAYRMEIYLGNPGGADSMYVTSFPVGLGKDNSTPTGLWLCKAGEKIRNPRYYPPASKGGDVLAPDDPKNPLGGYWIAIEGQNGQAVGKESYGIHGTIEPDSIGKMASMGCIRLRQDDISWVFDLLVDGKSKVLIKD